MPVSPEQRKILLERLEMARKAKAQKAEGVPNTPAPVERKKVAPIAKPAQPQAPPPPPQPQQHEVEEYDEPPVEEAPKKVWSRPRISDSAPAQHGSDQKAPTTKKNKYMKVVFYSEPPKSKVENLLKSLDDSEDVPPPAKRTAPPPKRAAPAAAPAKAKPKPAKRQQGSGDDLEELARLYFS